MKDVAVNNDPESNIEKPAGGFPMQGMMMDYNLFMPRLFNWCKSLGFDPGKIMPSRAFCSDESQGYPIILMTKHFGTFPFNHGRVGGVVATGRHGPHAAHGRDMVIVQASHVGYDPEQKAFGIYRRAHTTHEERSSSCGKIHNVISWYKNEYAFARHNILLHNDNESRIIVIDNQLLREDRDEGLFLRLDRFIDTDADGQHSPTKILSTAKVFKPASSLVQHVGEGSFNGITPKPIGTKLVSDSFYFNRNIPRLGEGAHHIERNMIGYMPQIVTAPSPVLTAAQINTQIEFDRTFRTIVKEQGYKGKKVLFIAGLNIDISPEHNQLFPLTKFVPWAAYVQDRDGFYYTLEQQELVQLLAQQSTDNHDQIDLEQAIQMMTELDEVNIDI
ncbi:MAG: hypothetical protein JSW45_02950 [Thiotrichales bacterium]|nr:MAG: hypothetical protein JSW45_02950 [Thiotrichales bacterium]